MREYYYLWDADNKKVVELRPGHGIPEHLRKPGNYGLAHSVDQGINFDNGEKFMKINQLPPEFLLQLMLIGAIK